MALPVTITGLSTAVAPVGPFKVGGTYPGAAVADTSGIAVSASGVINGGTGAGIATGQSFTNGPSATTITSVVVYLFKAGTPTDNLWAEISQTDPSGALLATSNTVAGSAVTATTLAGANAVTFTFPTPPAVAGSATFGVRVFRVGSDGVNYYQIPANTANAYAGGSSWLMNSVGWSASSGVDLRMTVNGSVTIADAYYFFGRDGTTATTLQAFKSTAPDTSWASIATKTGFTTAILNLSGYQVGTTIHLLVQHGTASTALATFYISYDAIADNFLTAETVSAAVAVTGQIAGAGANASIVVRSNGEVVAFYSGLQTKSGGTFRSRVYYRRRTGVAIWSAETQVDTNTTVDNSTPIAALGAADRVHFICLSGTTCLSRTLSAANALSAGSAVTGFTSVGDAVSYDRSGTTKVVFISSANGSLLTARFDSADNVNPTVTNLSIAAATIPQRIGTDPLDDSVTIVYRSSADSDLYSIKSTNDGASFGAPVSLFVGTVANADTAVSRSASGSLYARGSNVVIGYVVNDNGTWKYNEYVVRQLGASGTGTLASGVSAVAGSGAVVSQITGTGALQAVARTTATNLLLWSEQVDQWLQHGEVAVGANAGTPAPDGSYTAEFVTDNTNNAQHFVGQTLSASSTETYTFSIYLYKWTLDWVQLYITGNAGDFIANFNVGNGTTGWTYGNTTANITPVGSGWYRCSLTMDAISGNAIYLYLFTAPGDVHQNGVSYAGSNQTVAVWGGQFEAGSVPTAYIQTTSAPVTVRGGVAGVGVVVSLPATGTGALNAQSATTATVGVSSSSGTGALQAAVSTRSNQLTYSQDLDNSAWSPQNVSVAANATTAPDSTLTAEQFTDTTANQPHYAYQQLVIPSRAATVSVYAKSGTLNWLQILVSGQGGYAWGNFNTTTGATGQFQGSPVLSTTVLGNGWVRCSIAVTGCGDNPVIYLMLLPSDLGGYSYIGTGTGTLSLWGAQFEDGGVATAYIPTTNNPVSISDRPIVGIGVVATVISGTGALAATVATLAGVGVATVRGTAVLTSGTAALVASGSSASTGTATLPGTISTLSAAGKSISTGTAVLPGTTAALTASGTSTSKQTAAALSATTATLQAAGLSSTVGSSGTLAGQVAALTGTGLSASAGTGALSPAISTLAGSGVVQSGVTGSGSLTSVATLAGAGLSSGTGTGTVSCSVTVLAGLGVSASLGTIYALVAGQSVPSGAGVSISTGSGVLPGTVSILSGTGAGVTLITGTGVLAATTAIASGAGVSSSQGTIQSLSAGQIVSSGAGVSRWVATGALTANTATLSGAGVSAWIGTGALADQTSALVGSGVTRWVASGTLAASTPASIFGAGTASYVASGALLGGAAALVAVGSSSSTATGALLVGPAAISGFEGVAIISGAGTLLAQVSQVGALALSRSQGTGVLPSGNGALLATGSSQSLGAGAIPPSSAALAASGTSASSGSALLASGVASAVGSGVVLPAVTGTGTLAAGAATVLGAQGVVIIQGQGDLHGQVAQVVASGVTRSIGVGALINSDVAQVDAVGLVQAVGTGALAGSRSTATGTGGGLSLGSGAVDSGPPLLNGVGLLRWAAVGFLPAGPAQVTSVGFSASVGSGVLKAEVVTVTGDGLLLTTGAGTLAARSATVFGAAILATAGAGVLVAQEADIAASGLGRSSGSGALISAAHFLDGEGVSKSAGQGVLAAKPSQVAGFASLTAYGAGDLAAQPAVVSGNNLVVGAGAIVPAVSTVAGTGDVGEPTYPAPKPLPGGYPGTLPWYGGVATRGWNVHGIPLPRTDSTRPWRNLGTGEPTLPLPPWWNRAA